MALESPLREEHEKAGATLGVYFHCRLPERFADPAAEYRMAREAVALVDTNFRAFLDLAGSDRVRYLNAILTNNVKDLTPDQGTVSLLLNPQGRILAEVETYATADRLLAVCHALVRQRTVETLDKFIIMDDVTLEDATDRTGSLAIEGPQAARLIEELCGVKLDGLAPCAHVEATAGSIPCRLIRRSLFGETGAELLAERSQLGMLWQRLFEATRGCGGGAIGYGTLNTLRLEAGIPWFSYDFDERYIPHEAALDSSHISYTKGCYTGQEIVERVRSRGHVNRRRVSLQFVGEAMPEPGAKLLAEGKEAGHVTSATHSPALGGGIGMGYVRREYIVPGSRLQWERGAAEVVELPRRAQTGQ